MRTCPYCFSRDRKKFRFLNHIDTACANCGYVFKEDRLNLRKSFFKRLKEILELAFSPDKFKHSRGENEI